MQQEHLLSTVKRLKQEHANTDQTKQEGETMKHINSKLYGFYYVVFDDDSCFLYCVAGWERYIGTEANITETENNL